MRGSFKVRVGFDRDPAEVAVLWAWATRAAPDWPEETLRWLVGPGPEPAWVAMTDLLFVREPDGPTADEVRAAREHVSRAAAGRVADDRWSTSIDVRGTPIGFEVHSTDVAGRWSGWTLALFDDDDPPWVRFEPKTAHPTRRWEITTSTGLFAEIDGTDHDAPLRIDTRQTLGREEIGAWLIDASADRIDLAGTEADLRGDHGRLRSLALSAVPGKKLQVKGQFSALVRPLWWNLGTVVWPFIRRRALKSVASEVEATLRAAAQHPDWPAAVATARVAMDS